MLLQKLANVFEQPVAEQIEVFTAAFFQLIGFTVKCQILCERLMAYSGIYVCHLFCL